MKPFIRLSFVTASLLLALAMSVPAQDASPGVNSGEASATQPQASGPAGQLDFQTDLFTGRMGYSVPFPLAPARHGSTPGVSLRYSSGGESDWCGLGWSLDLGYIERETRKGVPIQWGNGVAVAAYDDAKGFVFNLNGQSSPLVAVGNEEYRAELEGGFLRFLRETNSNRWRVIGKDGSQYFFGQTNLTRMSNTRSGWSSNAVSGTFRWALDRIETVNGDVTSVIYTNLGGKLYPHQLSYNGHTSGLGNSCTVQFLLTTRSDVTTSFKSGYRVEQSRLLDAIVHRVDGALVWSNKFTYAVSPSTRRALLSSVTRFGTNATEKLPPVTFDYSDQSFTFQSAVNWTNLYRPNPGGVDYFLVSGAAYDLADLDGDGLPDRVVQPYQAPYTNWWVQHNTGAGFGTAVSWPLGYQSFSGNTTSNSVYWTALESTHGRLLDLDADGLSDWITDPYESYFNGGSSNIMTTNYSRLVAQLSGSTNLLPAVSWTNVEDQIFGSDPNGQMGSYRAVENTVFTRLVDMNADGLPDRVMRKRYQPYTYYVVQFNTGAGFTGTNAFGPYLSQGRTNDTDWAALQSSLVRLLDINGDSLPDRVMLRTNALSSGAGAPQVQTNFVVELNNGSGFETATNWTGVDPRYNLVCGGGTTGGFAELGDSYQLALRDVNGDNLVDRVLLPQCPPYTNWLVQINTGSGFAPVINWGPITSQGYTNDATVSGIQTTYASLLDINGDGLPDHVTAKRFPTTNDNYFVVELGKGPLPDLLTVISNGIGGVVSATYKPSTQYDNRETNSAGSRYLLPFPIYTVSSVSVSDGIYASNTTTNIYEGGYWNTARREFNGFARVSTIDPLGMTNIQWFHQSGGRNNAASGEYDDSAANLAKRGMPYRSETWGSDGKLYALTLNKVEDEDLGDGRHFAFVSQTLELDYPGSTNNYRATAQQFAYDLATGNLTDQAHLSEVTSVDIATHGFTDTNSADNVYQFTTFAALSNTDILDKPERTALTTDAAGTAILRESLFSYDGATGNLLTQRDRMCAECYTTNTFAYDSYGNPNSHTDPAGIVTTTMYDTTYRTFPVEQTVGGSFTSTMSFDPRSGQLRSATDAKGLVTSNRFDAFLRPIETLVSTTPNGAASQWITRYDYRLGMASGFSTNSVRVRTVDDVDASNGHESWTYADGLGRIIQTRVEAETNGFRVVDTVYDKRGSVVFETLPYFGTGTNFVKPTGTLMGTLSRFDAVGRLTNATAAVNGTFSSGLLTTTNLTGGDSSSSPIGSLGLAYQDGTDPWVTIRTDEEGKVKKFKFDAFGRTNQIVEPGNSTTTFGFNGAGSLTNITDHANNKIEYAYNDLGQLVAMADPDLGVWQYKRDSAGRLREQEDAKGQKVRFNYNDALGRLVSRQVYAKGGVFMYGVTNTYDSNGGDSGFTVLAGQLFKTVDAEGWTKNSNDVRNRVLKTVRYLSKNGQSYTNQLSYDNANRVTANVYPNGGPTLTNLFDLGGNLSQVKQVGSSNTVFWAARGWNALGQSLGANFGNGVSTTNDYYANSKRLKRVFTYKTGGTNLQDLTYTFDKVSNLKSIVDGAYTSTNSAALSSLIYDDLHRLTSLTRPAISQTHSFSYDPIGNLTVNGEAGAGTYSYGTRLPHAVKSANGVNYAYDANGNMLVRGMQRLDYDAENRLLFVLTLTSTNTFGYDAGGARLWKQGATNLQLWIGGNYEEKNGLVLFHILAGGQSVCTFDSTGTNVFEYYHGDHLRSTSVLTDKNGNRLQHHEYSAFGRDRFTESGSAFPISRRYTGQVLDEDTGLYYYNARYYDPQLARFIQPDTILPDLANPQSFNRYTYTLNNPLRYTDPSGHEPEDDDDIPLTLGAAHAAQRRSAGQASAKIYNQAGADSRTVAGGLRVTAEMNPLVGGFNAGSQVIRRKDAIDHHTLSGQEVAWSVVDAGASAAGPLGKFATAGKVLGAAAIAGKIADDAGDLRKVERGVKVTKGASTAETTTTIRNAHLAGKAHPVTGIPFDKAGFPDFSSVMTKEVKIKFTGDRALDFKAANQAAKLDKTPLGKTWHHHQDGTTMQLVPTDIHRATGHTGGFSLQ